MTIVDKVIEALADAERDGVTPAALVLGEPQYMQAKREVDRSSGPFAWSIAATGEKIFNLPVLVSEHVVGPLLVDAAARHQLEKSPLFRWA